MRVARKIDTLLIATTSSGKFREIAAELAGVNVRLICLRDVPELPQCEEHGETFQENADEKARFYATRTGYWTLADDSGLQVDALNGQPGVRSARYAGQPRDDRANNRKLIEALADVPRDGRSARFRSAVAIAQPNGSVVARATGTVEGVIIDQPRGQGGFGYDPHFFVPELGKTTAELSRAEKNEISHRGQAVREIQRQPAVSDLFAAKADE